MAQGSAGTHRNPYKLLFLETVLHVLAVGVFYTRFAQTLPTLVQYAVIGAFAGAVALRALVSMASAGTSTLTGNFGGNAGALQPGTAVLLAPSVSRASP